ncbi:hypothetical protein BRC90_03100 [Halobacteriales archaeon QS_4_69_34]|nr:MAG: hypothetical protein BRC90_03100 [Halobacteriales archaeon QS_4_69_34]
MLTKDLLRVSRAGGGYHPQFAERGDRPLAARVIGVYRGHVGEPKGDLDAALEALEREAGDFKLVRGFAKLLEREATFETRAAIEPERARTAAFAAAESVGVVTAEERGRALSRAADELGSTPEAVERSLYADLEARQVLVAFDARWGPEDLLAQYDLSLAQTALFDATEVRIRSSEPKALVSAVKRLRLLYEIRKTDADDDRQGAGVSHREVVITGPDSLFRSTRRYGTAFARLLRTVAEANEWRLVATIDDRGTERELVLTEEDVRVPGTEPVADVSYDSGVEADFATRFSSLDLDWALVREPEPLESGARVMIPDFAFDWPHGDFRVYFEIMGFWTPEYVAKKLDQLDRLEAVDMLVAVDDSLGVGAEIEARDARAIAYSGSVRVKDVRDALRRYEDRLNERSAAELPEELVPDADVVGLTALADRYGVGVAAIEGKSFPAHELVGRTLVRPSVLESLADTVEPGMALAEAEAAFDEHGIDDASAALSTLGYRVEWAGLSGGTVREK